MTSPSVPFSDIEQIISEFDELMASGGMRSKKIFSRFIRSISGVGIIHLQSPSALVIKHVVSQCIRSVKSAGMIQPAHSSSLPLIKNTLSVCFR